MAALSFRRFGLLALAAIPFALAHPALAAFETSASHVYITDFDTGAVLYDKAGEDRIPTASLSKMMTAYVVFDQLKQGKLKLDDELPVSENAWRTGGSKMFVPLNGKVKVEDLIRGMVIQSGNDACVVLAEGIAGSTDNFVGMMNEIGKKIGLKDSHFASVDGLPDPDHYMTARDLDTLGTHLIKDFPEYYHYFSEIDFTYNGIKQGNRNPLLYKNSGADGIKTGHTEEAGFGLTASVKRNGRHIIMVATGLQSMKGRSQEGEAIVDFAFREFQNYQIVKKGDEVDQADVWLGQQPKVPLVATQDLLVTLPRGSRKDMKVTVSYDGPLQAPVAAGTVVGTLTVTAPDMQPQSVPIAAGGDDARLGPMGRMAKGLEGLIWGTKS
ncbi:D-alanyl-D-alanine carboxypeptidase [Aliidongia dinghuensis]|uniref:serine-type D-Ala-D-Ala carboxypeptidase n=1 Tax=Aliidongia dinghuensis TaxID=1867774 RepID=A0A8J2YTV6_9PROT|nr:D-alanyl-D-alanine carboxypeptidase family protein [Aliidongia dinghuensis]GGF14454.1 D-alanyl-D-alanine carboxypeptidase [Aliidongia dinghuensis]